jgi:hypothetical protein
MRGELDAIAARFIEKTCGTIENTPNKNWVVRCYVAQTSGLVCGDSSSLPNAGAAEKGHKTQPIHLFVLQPAASRSRSRGSRSKTCATLAIGSAHDFPLAIRARKRHFIAVEIFLSICIGIGLSAACGFRVFVPLFCLSLASHFNVGGLQLAPSFAWLSSMPAMIVFGAATVAEIAAYYIPWVDNFLDTIAVPSAAIAGVIVTAAVVTDIGPLWKWALAIIAGGGIATTTQLATTKARVTSSATTGGLGNPVLATVENVFSTVLSVLAVVWPIVAFVLAIIVAVAAALLIFLAARMFVKIFRRKQPDEEEAVVNA